MVSDGVCCVCGGEYVQNTECSIQRQTKGHHSGSINQSINQSMHALDLTHLLVGGRDRNKELLGRREGEPGETAPGLEMGMGVTTGC